MRDFYRDSKIVLLISLIYSMSYGKISLIQLLYYDTIYTYYKPTSLLSQREP